MEMEKREVNIETLAEDLSTLVLEKAITLEERLKAIKGPVRRSLFDFNEEE